MKLVLVKLLRVAGLLGICRMILGAAADGGRAIGDGYRTLWRVRQQSRDLGRALAKLGPARKGPLIVTEEFSAAGVMLQGLPIIAFQRSGYEVVILMSARGRPWMEGLYRIFGARKFRYLEDHFPAASEEEARDILGRLTHCEQLRAIKRHGIPVGELALASYMRRYRDGDPQLDHPSARKGVEEFLATTLRNAAAVRTICDELNPALGMTIDRGYTPQGDLFHCVISKGGTCITMNASHRGGALVFKRYGDHNRTLHPTSLSEESWRRFREMKWTPAHWQRLRTEVEQCYAEGEWYSAAGSQFNKTMASVEDLRARLKLDPSLPVAVMFPHMFWDASFAWGTDLFRHYEEWFRETVKAMCRNDRLNWVIKIHPANATKDARDGYEGEHSELRAMRDVVGELPPHVRLLNSGSEISTLAVYRLMDYCLTVRGTAGVEAAMYGKPVFTAGTGRYSGRGFTRDSRSAQEYLDRLARLEREPAMTEQEIELARRFAYGIFIGRPRSYETIRFNFQRDRAASLRVDIGSDGDVAGMRDVRALSDWIDSGKDDYLDEDRLASERLDEPLVAASA